MSGGGVGIDGRHRVRARGMGENESVVYSVVGCDVHMRINLGDVQLGGYIGLSPTRYTIDSCGWQSAWTMSKAN